mmetsp:Transcript_32556/g.66053  ORF Transcript_32556/g.66053 Transcript_32556/m.66053 type:complete len:214 (-) Transcript_32556:13-654(-)
MRIFGFPLVVLSRHRQLRSGCASHRFQMVRVRPRSDHLRSGISVLAARCRQKLLRCDTNHFRRPQRCGLHFRPEQHLPLKRQSQLRKAHVGALPRLLPVPNQEVRRGGPTPLHACSGRHRKARRQGKTNQTHCVHEFRQVARALRCRHVAAGAWRDAHGRFLRRERSRIRAVPAIRGRDGTRMIAAVTQRRGTFSVPDQQLFVQPVEDRKNKA